MIAACCLAMTPLRKEPKHQSEMTSQMLFGETAEILELRDDWLKIELHHDKYIAWAELNALTILKVNCEFTKRVFIKDACTKLKFQIGDHDSPIYLPLGTAIPITSEDHYHYTVEIKNLKVTADKQIFHETLPASKDNLVKHIKKFINIPYLWGGRTANGVDCSGFTQMIFKMFGFQLLRDAYQQANQGKPISFDRRQTGDLVFFMNDETKYTHVGVLLSPDQIIHASGQVRTDVFDQKGIYRSSAKKHTHYNFIIKRVIDFQN